MKVALVFPNFFVREHGGKASDPPIGLISIAAVLRNEGHLVCVVDANAEDLSESQTVERVMSFQPDLVGISCNYAPLHNPTLMLASRLKEAGTPYVVAGGNHASALAAHLLRSSDDLDAVAVGEGESIMPVLARVLEGAERDLSAVPGLVFRSDGGIVENEPPALIADLDSLPMPAYDLLPMDLYERYNVVTSRGCPFSCSYCASNTIFAGRVRYRSPGLVVEEMRHLRETYGDRHVWFSDDTFISNRNYTSRLMDEMERAELGMTWSCLTRVSIVDKSLLERMRDAGCTYVSYGIESGNQAMLDAMGKRITIAQVREALAVTAEVGLRRYAFFIVGFPGESWETVMDSYRLLETADLDGAAFNILIPLPGTPLMDRLLAEGFLTLDDVRWDYLFARASGEQYERYSAELASQWCDLSAQELVEACIVGHHLPDVFRALGRCR